MNLGKSLTDNVKSWGVLAIVIVVISLIILKFKIGNVGDITCSGTKAYYNASSNLCCLGTATTPTNCLTGNTTAIGDVAQTIDIFVSGLSEPKNWLIIAIISLVGFGILKYFSGKDD